MDCVTPQGGRQRCCWSVPQGPAPDGKTQCWEKPEMKNVFAFAVALAVVLSAGVQAEAGLFGCKKDKCCASACEPTCCEAEPVCCEEPAPCCEPAPVCEPAPCAPVCEEPAPCCEPAPTCCEPAPVCCDPCDPCCKPKRCGFFARMKAKRCCQPVCCAAPAPCCG